MVGWLVLLLVALGLSLLVRAAWRGTELFCVSVVDGELALERGRMPPALFTEMADVVRMHRVRRATIRAVLSGGSPRLVFEHDGAGQAAEQPLRNVLGRFTRAQLRSGQRRAK